MSDEVNSWEADGPSNSELQKQLDEIMQKEEASTTPPAAPATPTPSEPVAGQQSIDKTEVKPETPAAPAAPQLTMEQIEARIAAREEQVRMQYQQQLWQVQQQMEAMRAAQTPKQPEFTVEQLQQMAQNDPLTAIRQAALTDPRMAAIERQLTEFKQWQSQQKDEAFYRRLENNEAAVKAKYQDFKEGSPVYKATFKWAQQNADFLRSWAEQNPKFNPIEHAYKTVAYDLVLQRMANNEQKLVDKRAKSGSVKPGASAPVTHLGDSAARAAAADLAEKGQVVPDEWVRAAERAGFGKQDF